MLNKLTIDNYALIDKSIIDFHQGFTVITGETGAGKSIMLDALSLLSGARADYKAMGNKERKTIVEAIFTNPMSTIKAFCEDNAIDWDDNELILRREILVSGKSRSFINDTPVNLSTLSTVTNELLNIHSQHSNSILNRTDEQLSILDSFGDTKSLLKEYKNAFKEYVALRANIKRIKENISRSKENEEFIRFKLEQLDKIKPKKGELAVLEKEAELLGDSDRIKSDLIEINDLLDTSEYSVMRNLQKITAILENLDLSLLDHHENDSINERLNSLKIELRDISDTIETYSENINSDPHRLEVVQRRIETLYDTIRRFKVKDEKELVELYQNLKEELSSIDENEEDIPKLEGKLKELAKVLKEKADTLSSSRKQTALQFSKTLIEKIIPLGLPNVNFLVDIKKGKMTSEGQDIVTFLCSFNKNHSLQPISEIASGGEISRVMLGIKSVMASKMQLPTIIFDEIDTGISGEIAHKMGKMMNEMAESMQVLAITHLPQVAANGKFHLKVYKEDMNEKTISHIRELNQEERITEIAGMLSGNSINDIAMENARILMKDL